MEQSAKIRSAQCRRIATNLRTNAARTQLHSYAAKMINMAEDLEREAVELKAAAPDDHLSPHHPSEVGAFRE